MKVHEFRKLQGNSWFCARKFVIKIPCLRSAHFIGERYVWEEQSEQSLGIMNADMILFLILTGIYVLLGSLGNGVILMVYSYRRQKDVYNQNFFIKVLAALDLVVCVVIMPYTIFFEFHRVHNDVVCKMMEIVRHIAILTSNSVLCAIAFERYFAICYPTKKLDQQAIQKIMISLTAVTVLFSAPAPTIFAVTENKISGNVEEYCQFTTKVIGVMGTNIYQGFLILLCMSGIITIIVLYALIYRRLLHRTLRRRRCMSRSITPSKYIVRKITNGRGISGELPEGSGAENEVVLCLVENVPMLESKRSKIQLKGVFESKSSKSANKTTKPENSEISDEHSSDTCVNNQNNEKSPDCRRKLPGPKMTMYTYKHTDFRHRAKPNVRRKTSIMLFVCSLIYLVTWGPFWLDVFNVTRSLVLRYLFFFGHASNPVVYGIINNQVRADVNKLLTRRWCVIISQNYLKYLQL